MADAIKAHADKGPNSQQSERQAEDLRRRAQDLWDHASPEERERLRQWPKATPTSSAEIMNEWRRWQRAGLEQPCRPAQSPCRSPRPIR